MRKLLLCALLALPLTSVIAEEIPLAGAYDARVKMVTYSADDVVKIIGHYGYSTDVQFAPGESVVNIALGDSLAWEVAPAGNHLFVKPREDNAVTNMTVVTNARVYQMSLDARESKGMSGGRSTAMFFAVRYRYPELDAAKAKADFDARMFAYNKRKLEGDLNAKPVAKNWNYYACGSRALWPSEVFDDGRFTYLRFPGAHEIPSIFVVKPDGTESIADGNMRGDFYELHSTAQRIVLRSGTSVACIQNRSYNPWGVYTPNKTTSPDVKRVEVNVPDTNAAAPTMAPPPTQEATGTATGTGATAAPVRVTPLPFGGQTGQQGQNGNLGGNPQ